MAISEEQLRVIEQWLSEELADAESVKSDASSCGFARFLVSAGSAPRYRLAVTDQFFTAHPTPTAIVSELETRFVARELRDHPGTWLLLCGEGPPLPFGPERAGEAS